MKRSKRIAELKKLLDRQAEQEAIKLAELQKKLITDKNKIAQLQDFRGEYINSSVQIGSRFIPAQLQDREKLVKQLDYAINQQSKHIEMLQKHIEYQRRAWLKLHGKVEAYQRWIEKLIEEENLIETRQDQKKLDEFVTNQYTRKG